MNHFQIQTQFHNLTQRVESLTARLVDLETRVVDLMRARRDQDKMSAIGVINGLATNALAHDNAEGYDILNRVRKRFNQGKWLE